MKNKMKVLLLAAALSVWALPVGVIAKEENWLVSEMGSASFLFA